jgi:hypothetical protein
MLGYFQDYLPSGSSQEGASRAKNRKKTVDPLPVPRSVGRESYLSFPGRNGGGVIFRKPFIG